MTGDAIEKAKRMPGAQVRELIQGTFGTIQHRRKLFLNGNQIKPDIYITVGSLKGITSEVVGGTHVQRLLATDCVFTSPQGIDAGRPTSLPFPQDNQMALVRRKPDVNVKIVWSEQVGDVQVVDSLILPDF